MNVGQLRAIMDALPDNTEIAAYDSGDESVGIFAGTFAIASATAVMDVPMATLMLRLEV